MPTQLAFAFLLAGLCLAGAGVNANDPPNLIVTLSDDFSSSEIGHLTRGFPSLEGASTPTLNKMKNEGVSFLTAWAMPICGPARGSLLTGLYGQVTGWLSNKKPDDGGLGVNYGTFANLAKENGYTTMIAGKWQMTGNVPSYGFDESCLWSKSGDPSVPLGRFYREYDESGGFINPSNTPLRGQRSRYWHPFIIENGTLAETGPNVFGPNVIFDCAMDFISRQTALGNKFLLYMPMLLTHSDWDYFLPESQRSITNFIPVPRVNRAGNIIGREPSPGSMKRNIEYQDYLMGRLMRHVEREGQRQNTVTLFTADNGSLGYGKKRPTTERSTRVPFIFHGPGRILPRAVTSQFASINDVYATVAGLIGANTGQVEPSRPQSIDISPFLLGKQAKTGRRWLYGYLEDPDNRSNNGRWIRNRRYILDGNEDLWRCPTFDERSCIIVDPTTDAQAARVKRLLDIILCLLEKNRPVDPTRLRQASGCTP